MVENQCNYLLPNYGPEAEFVILIGACLLRDDHGQDDHLVCMNNPILAPEFILWTPDRENDDGSEDYQDYVYRDITRREALELLQGSWGYDRVQEMIKLIKDATQ